MVTVTVTLRVWIRRGRLRDRVGVSIRVGLRE